LAKHVKTDAIEIQAKVGGGLMLSPSEHKAPEKPDYTAHIPSNYKSQEVNDLASTMQKVNADAINKYNQWYTEFQLFANSLGESVNLIAAGARPKNVMINLVTDAIVPPGQVETALNSVPTVQKFTSSTGTYTTPAGVLYIKVRMVGGGGGGGGGGTGGGTGGTGGTSTFGTTLLSAVGGVGGTGAGAGGAGGTASLGTGPIGVALSGGSGGGGTFEALASTQYPCAGAGAASPFGGAGGGQNNAAGYAGITNTGSGGGGGSAGGGTSAYAAGGGGAGGYIEAIITSPGATYSYAVGAAGTAGATSTGGYAGGAGSSGIIIVEEYYQ
jgi:hypothetical protein